MRIPILTSERSTHLLWLVAAVMAVAALGAYFWMFHGKLSPNLEDWVGFGTYIGGTLGPGFAFLAFVLGLQTLKMTRQQASCSDILRAVERYERELNSCMDMPVTCKGPWIQDEDPNKSREVDYATLRFLLLNDAVLWEAQLKNLVHSYRMRQLPNGDLIHEPELVAHAFVAIRNLYAALRSYEHAGGNVVFCKSLRHTYIKALYRLQKVMAP